MSSLGRQPVALAELVADAGGARTPEGSGEAGENAVGENAAGENAVGENAVGENVVWENRVPAGLTVMADREQLFRVMVNIGRNALDAGARRIEVTAAVRVGWISLAVKDDGPGIPEKARERLFQPFVGRSEEHTAELQSLMRQS